MAQTLVAPFFLRMPAEMSVMTSPIGSGSDESDRGDQASIDRKRMFNDQKSVLDPFNKAMRMPPETPYIRMCLFIPLGLIYTTF